MGCVDSKKNIHRKLRVIGPAMLTWSGPPGNSCAVKSKKYACGRGAYDKNSSDQLETKDGFRGGWL